MRVAWIGLVFVFGSCVPECRIEPIHFDFFPDAPPRDTLGAPCNIFAQDDCNAGERCTWLHDPTADSVGHLACAPDGTIALGQACYYGSDGAFGYDDCTKGNVCVDGICERICWLDGGAPTCDSTHACTFPVDGTFDLGGFEVAGTCAKACDPLADNDALGSGSRPGNACGSGAGCFGSPSLLDAPIYVCHPERNPTLVHRSQCTSANGCATTTHVTIDGCAQGYEPIISETTGSSTVVCVAFCAPADCWLGNCPNEQLRGSAPHDCTPASARGTFAVASAGGSNGDQCMYSWVLTADDISGNHVASPTDNTVGFCIDHSQYTYDSNGNNMVDGSDAAWPRCDTLDIGSGSAFSFDAIAFGCVSTATATAHGHPPAQLVNRPRLPFRAVAR